MQMFAKNELPRLMRIFGGASLYSLTDFPQGIGTTDHLSGAVRFHRNPPTINPS